MTDPGRKKKGNNDFWQTPPRILEKVEACFGPGWFDPCPIKPSFDGLEIDWSEHSTRFYINPPYSYGSLEVWSRKAYKEFQKGPNVEIIWLINYGCTYNRDVIKSTASAICDLKGPRISFINPDTGLPGENNDRDSVIYYWGEHTLNFSQHFSSLGAIFAKRWVL